MFLYNVGPNTYMVPYNRCYSRLRSYRYNTPAHNCTLVIIHIVFPAELMVHYFTLCFPSSFSYRYIIDELNSPAFSKVPIRFTALIFMRRYFNIGTQWKKNLKMRKSPPKKKGNHPGFASHLLTSKLKIQRAEKTRP